MSRKRGQACANAGSLLGDISKIATSIFAALANDDVTVWVSSGADIFYAHAREAPEIAAEYVLGTYRMGAAIGDIEEDLRELRRSRVCGAMIF